MDFIYRALGAELIFLKSNTFALYLFAHFANVSLIAHTYIKFILDFLSKIFGGRAK